MMIKQPTIYILASKRNRTLYVGVTGNLVKRIWEHKNDVQPGFTNNYHVHRLVYFEQHPTMETAITREKRIKKWNRQWKIDLIEKNNPQWRVIYGTIFYRMTPTRHSRMLLAGIHCFGCQWMPDKYIRA